MLWSIGHSNHSFAYFVALLKGAGVEVLADVRSRPYSRFVPAYNQDILKTALEQEGLTYVFVGEELGGKRAGGYYERIATPAFQGGIETLRRAEGRTAMMCAERHPLDCHRCRLIGRYLLSVDEDVAHILSDGGQVRQSVVEAQLLEAIEPDLFIDEAERLERAYAWRR